MKIKSIFTKQLLLYVGTLFANFILVGMVLSLVYTQHYMDETKEDLINQGMKISKEYKRAYFTGDLSNLAYELQILEDYMSASIFFIDKNGVVVLASPGIDDAWIGQTITNQNVMDSVLDGQIVSLEGKINGMFDDPVLTVGYPLQTEQIAGIFMCTSMLEIERSLQGMYQMGFFILTAIMGIGIIFVYIFSKRISSPLLQMNEAVKVIAGGNFEQRVEINSEDEVGQLAESFNHMAESLDKYEKVRRDFIANVSHDLRSPLTSIQGFLGAILDGTIPHEKQEHYLNIVLEETKRLTKLTNDIVELSRAQTSTITLEKTPFPRILAHVTSSTPSILISIESTNFTIMDIFSLVNNVPFVIIPICPLNRFLVYSNKSTKPSFNNGSPPVKIICSGLKVIIFSIILSHSSKVNTSGTLPAFTLQCLHFKLHLSVMANVIYLGISFCFCLFCVITSISSN